MISLMNYDFQGSGEQWGRDEIYPDLSWMIENIWVCPKIGGIRYTPSPS